MQARDTVRMLPPLPLPFDEHMQQLTLGIIMSLALRSLLRYLLLYLCSLLVP